MYVCVWRARKHTRTHIYIYIYIYMYVCVLVYICTPFFIVEGSFLFPIKNEILSTDFLFFPAFYHFFKFLSVDFFLFLNIHSFTMKNWRTKRIFSFCIRFLSLSLKPILFSRYIRSFSLCVSLTHSHLIFSLFENYFLSMCFNFLFYQSIALLPFSFLAIEFYWNYFFYSH